MSSWISKFLKMPREIGSIAPSSPALGKLMTRGIASNARVVELGPGNGAITEYILKRLANPSQLTLVEMDKELAADCRKRFPGTNVVTEDAEAWLTQDTGTYDVILSGIPFAVMAAEKRHRTFRRISERLAQNGRFIMFQYSLTTREELKTIFGEVTTEFTLWNLPPAFVFMGRKNR